MDRGVRFYVNCSHRLRFFLRYRKHSTHTGDDKRLLRPVLRVLRAVGDRGLKALYTMDFGAITVHGILISEDRAHWRTEGT